VTGRGGLAKSFGYALAGLAYAVRTQRNLRIHLFLGFTAVGVALFLRLSPVFLLILGLTITLVLAAELFNTALEAAVDLQVTVFRPLAKAAKDVAAAAVLVTAANALVTGLFLFGPRWRALPPLFLDVMHTWLAVLAAAGFSLLVRPCFRARRAQAPAWGVAAAVALGARLGLATGLYGPALCLLLAGLVPACGGPCRISLPSFLGGAAAGVTAGLLTAHWRW